MSIYPYRDLVHLHLPEDSHRIHIRKPHRNHLREPHRDHLREPHTATISGSSSHHHFPTPHTITVPEARHTTTTGTTAPTSSGKALCHHTAKQYPFYDFQKIAHTTTSGSHVMLTPHPFPEPMSYPRHTHFRKPRHTTTTRRHVMPKRSGSAPR